MSDGMGGFRGNAAAHAAPCYDRAVADFGEPSRPSHISKMVLSIVKFGGPCGDRTHDTRIKSPVLCLTELTAR